MAYQGSELFSLEGVGLVRAGRSVLSDINLAIDGTEPMVIAGPSGSGKSSLLRLLNRLDAPTDGIVRYRGEDVATLAPTEHRRRVAMVFQRPVVLEGTVADNLGAADPALDDAAMAQALERVGLPAAMIARDARDLSGGEAQRMCLARSLATDPQVVLFDEATSSLDPANAARIEELALKLHDDGVGVVWVTHDLEQMARVGGHAAIVIDGRVAQTGPVADVMGNPQPDVAQFLAGTRS